MEAAERVRCVNSATTMMTGWEDIARWCLERRDWLNDWEQRFVEGMVLWIEEDKDPTRKTSTEAWGHLRQAREGGTRP